MKKHGFTLLEIVITLSLSSIILMAGIFLFSSIFRTYKVEAKKAEELQIQQMVLKEIVKDARCADKLALEGQKLVLTFKDFILSYEIKDKKIKRQKGGASAYLTENNEVPSLNFTMVKPGLLKIKTNLFETGVFCRNG